MTLSPLAGKPVPADQLIDVAKLTAAYFSEAPDPDSAEQAVAFGTSGHRGSSLKGTFNETHIIAIAAAICRYRASHDIDGPLFLGADTHALSAPALATTLEVLAAHGVEVMLSHNDEHTPTPALSRAILDYNRGRRSVLADGIVVTPSHNPPDSGGIKYNPPHGGPAESAATRWIQDEANVLLRSGVRDIKRIPRAAALDAPTTHRYDFLDNYAAELEHVIDLDCIRGSGLRLGVDPLGGAGLAYWQRIAADHRLDLEITNDAIDPTFRFMSLDWDGRIRMDPSSSYAMQSLLCLKDRFDVAFACDTDHDRHGIVTRSGGLMQPNHYLAAAIDYLFRHRPDWPTGRAVGKTLVSSALIDRLTARLGVALYETPVGFKWFVDGLLTGTLGFAGEESAGATFLMRDGGVWTTDKDGIVPSLLAAEMSVRTQRDPAELYQALTRELGAPAYVRIDAPATPDQKARLAVLSREQIRQQALAGDAIESILTQAPGNQAPIGGVKVTTANGWFAARPSGTEDVYKIYAESFRGEAHLRRIIEAAQALVDEALAALAP